MPSSFVDRVRRLVGPAASGAAEAADRAARLAGAAMVRQVRALPADRFDDAEFQAYSQFGEDGLIQFLLGHVEIPRPLERFVEFGVADYRESNTRFLLEHDGWEGLIMDAAPDHAEFVEQSGLRWRHTIDAVQSFITRDNLDDLLNIAGFTGEIGLMSIDLDGNDYWVWERMMAADPRIVIVEYNSLFGPDATVSVPYDPGFDRTAAHHSNLYWGTSLAALHHLAAMKGYRLVGSNRAGHNAFFVRDDVAGQLPARTPAQVWAPSRYRESRGPDGELTYITSHKERRRAIGHLPLTDVMTGATLHVNDLADPN